MSRVEPLVLRAGDEQRLREWTRSSTIPAGLAQRARIVLLAAEGISSAEVGRRVSLPTVHSWRVRYTTGGVDALGDLPRSGRPAMHDEQTIIAATLEPPPAALGVTHWVVAAARRPARGQLRHGRPDLAALGPEALGKRDVQVLHRP